MSEGVSGVRERSKQDGASERVSGESERKNGRASTSDPVLASRFLFVSDHSATAGTTTGKDRVLCSL